MATSSDQLAELRQPGSFFARSTLKVTLLGSEWNSSAGGLSTLNRELAIHLSKHPKVEVTLLVPEGCCEDKEKIEAWSYGVTIADAPHQPGYNPLDWLSFPPKDLSIDVVIGHGVKLGRQGQVIRNFLQLNNCKWVQVVHTAPEDLGKYKIYGEPTSKGEQKHQVEVDLCKRADLIVSVGPRLTEFYSSYLRGCEKDKDIFSFTPGLFDREFGDLVQSAHGNGDFRVLIFGRGDKEDFELKGYNIAAQAFTDPRLKKKPYQLIFVGAPEGKQDDVRERLLQCGVAKEQLIVRTFVRSRGRIKELLCEADLAIMPSKSEGFGLVALEALSAGLPILVGSRSGFAKALENIPHGHSCIVYSDDPAKWAEAIEAVRVRQEMRLQEINSLNKFYDKMYSWEEQCEALVERMWKMVHDQSWLSDESKRMSKLDSPVDTRREATKMEEGSFLNKENSQTYTSGSVCSPGSDDVLVKLTVSARELSKEQQEKIDEILQLHVQLYTENHKLSSPNGVRAFVQHITRAYNLAVESVEMGSLIITVKCPTLESLERLWSDYQSGCLDDIAEMFLLTTDIKSKLDLDIVRFKITIEEENYLAFKKALSEPRKKMKETERKFEEEEKELQEKLKELQEKVKQLQGMLRRTREGMLRSAQEGMLRRTREGIMRRRLEEQQKEWEEQEKAFQEQEKELQGMLRRTREEKLKELQGMLRSAQEEREKKRKEQQKEWEEQEKAFQEQEKELQGMLRRTREGMLRSAQEGMLRRTREEREKEVEVNLPFDQLHF